MSSAEESGEPSPSGSIGAREDYGSKLFLGGLSWDTSEEKLRDHFLTYGDLVEVVVMRDKMTGRPRGFGFVTFKVPESAERAVKDVHVIDVKKSVPQEGKPKACKVFVGGLAPETTENDFKAYFSKFGDIAEVQIMQDHMSGRSRGFGFVTFEEDRSAEKVFEYGNMHELGGKRVEVKAATPKGSGSQAPRQPTGRSSGEFSPSMMRPGYSTGMPGGATYPTYPMYPYSTRPGMMPPYGTTMQYAGMAPQYMMLPPGSTMPMYTPSGPAGSYPAPYPHSTYSGPGRGGAPAMPFTPPSPQGMLPQHPFAPPNMYQSSSPSTSPSPPHRSGGAVPRKNGHGRGKVDSASSLDAQHAERQFHKLSLD